MAFLEIAHVTKTFGQVEVLHDINIGVEEGEFLVLVGPSGCGKSTLLNMIAGLEQITSGTISIKGRVVNGIHPSRRNIAMVFQSYALYPNMSVAKNITFGLEMHGIARREREQALERIASMLQIKNLLDRKPGQLSGGQRQRVAMGRALVRNPDVFLFDEPLSNLDAKLRVELRTEIKELHQKLQTTMVYVTHDQVEAMTLASRIVVMNEGNVQQFGTPKQIYDFPENLFVAGFMGSPPMNLLPAVVCASDGDIKLQIQGRDGPPTELALGASEASLRNHAGRNVMIGIRPEAVTDPDSADRKSTTVRTIRSVVGVVEPTGSDTYATISIRGNDCIARMRSDVRVQPGQQCDFALNMDRAVYFEPGSGTRIGHLS